MLGMPFDAWALLFLAVGLGLTLDPSHFFAGQNQGKPFDEADSLVLNDGRDQDYRQDDDGEE